MRRTVRSTAARVLVSLTLLTPVVPTEPVAAVTCTDVHVVWARGANLGLDAFDWTRFVDTDLRQRIGPGVTMSDYQLGDPGFGGFS